MSSSKSLIFVLFSSLIQSNSAQHCTEELQKLTDPRSTFEVNLNSFKLNKNIETKNVIKVITEGQGFDILSDLFEPQEIQHAKDTIHYLIQKQGSKATHFQGGDGARPDLQARVWNLLNKGKIFEKMVQHPTLLNISRSLLGKNFYLNFRA